MRRVLLFIILIACTLLGFAQSGVEVKIEPIEMMIGEQAQVTVTVQAPEVLRLKCQPSSPVSKSLPVWK